MPRNEEQRKARVNSPPTVCKIIANGVEFIHHIFSSFFHFVRAAAEAVG